MNEKTPAQLGTQAKGLPIKPTRSRRGRELIGTHRPDGQVIQDSRGRRYLIELTGGIRRIK